MEDVLRRQSRLEIQEMDRLVRLRDTGEDGEYYVKRFVCGMSFEGAEESCNNNDNIGSSSSSSVGTSTSTSGSSSQSSAHYCPTGSSSQCPSDMECYSYVSCPRSSSSGEEPPPLIDDESMRLLNSLLARSTEPILLLNSTDVDDTIDSYDHVGTAGLMMEEWTTYNREDSDESQSILGRILSTFLSSHYGLN